jgi:hypothetical protein
MLHALNPNEHLIQMPLVSGSWPAAAQMAGKALAELGAPAAHTLVRHDDAPLGQQKLDIAQAEAEYVVQPDSLADDLGREAMAVRRIRWRLHPASVVAPHPARQIRLP